MRKKDWLPIKITYSTLHISIFILAVESEITILLWERERSLLNAAVILYTIDQPRESRIR